MSKPDDFMEPREPSNEELIALNKTKEAETQARGLIKGIIRPRTDLPLGYNVETLTNLFIKAGERDEMLKTAVCAYCSTVVDRTAGSIADHALTCAKHLIHSLKVAEKELDSLREKLELAKEQIKNLRKDSDYCNFTKQQLDEQRVYAVKERNLAQADCAVKHEALLKMPHNPSCIYHKQGITWHIGCDCGKIITLWTHPGQSLLDELKMLRANYALAHENLGGYVLQNGELQNELKLAKEKLSDSESKVLTLATLLNEAREKLKKYEP